MFIGSATVRHGLRLSMGRIVLGKMGPDLAEYFINWAGFVKAATFFTITYKTYSEISVVSSCWQNLGNLEEHVGGTASPPPVMRRSDREFELSMKPNAFRLVLVRRAWIFCILAYLLIYNHHHHYSRSRTSCESCNVLVRSPFVWTAGAYAGIRGWDVSTFFPLLPFFLSPSLYYPFPPLSTPFFSFPPLPLPRSLEVNLLKPAIWGNAVSSPADEFGALEYFVVHVLR